MTNKPQFRHDKESGLLLIWKNLPFILYLVLPNIYFRERIMHVTCRTMLRLRGIIVHVFTSKAYFLFCLENTCSVNCNRCYINQVKMIDICIFKEHTNTSRLNLILVCMKKFVLRG